MKNGYGRELTERHLASYDCTQDNSGIGSVYGGGGSDELGGPVTERTCRDIMNDESECMKTNYELRTETFSYAEWYTVS